MVEKLKGHRNRWPFNQFKLLALYLRFLAFLAAFAFLAGFFAAAFLAGFAFLAAFAFLAGFAAFGAGAAAGFGAGPSLRSPEITSLSAFAGRKRGFLLALI